MIQTLNKSNFLEEASADEDYQKKNLRVKPQISKREHEDSENNNKDSSRSISHNSHNKESDDESKNLLI